MELIIIIEEIIIATTISIIIINKYTGNNYNNYLGYLEHYYGELNIITHCYCSSNAYQLSQKRQVTSQY